MKRYRLTMRDFRKPTALGMIPTYLIEGEVVTIITVDMIQVGDRVRIPTCMDKAGMVTSVEVIEEMEDGRLGPSMWDLLRTE